VGGHLVSGAGVALVVVSLPLMLIFLGAALERDGPIAAAFVLVFCSIPVALGVGLAHLGRPGYWRREVDLRGLHRMPGAAGVAIALVTVPLIFLLPGAALLIALLALCLYPLLDVPRILARPSWWRGAMLSAAVWLAVFAGLTGAVESVAHPREDSMIFLLPFMMYPLVLAISGLVRLAGGGRPSESSVRTMAIVGAAACGLLVGVPITMGVIPVLLEKITGNSPRNTVTSESGDVVSTAPAQVSVRLVGGSTKSFRLGSETKFDFRGPGSPLVKGSPGPDWLTAGQRVGVEYVTRHREAQAQLVTIWIERKGCKGDAKWRAASGTAPSSPTLVGTTWEGKRASQGAPDGPAGTTFEFLGGDHLTYQDPGGPKYTDGGWRQDGPAVLIQVNDCYAEYEGRIDGDEIRGQFANEVGAHENWTARRNLLGASARVR
jgi:hypothetical protein